MFLDLALRPEKKLRRPYSSVSIEGLTKDGDNNRVKRVKVLSQEQHDAIASLQTASRIPHAERKRQWGALNRRLQKTDTLPAGVLAKWEAATSAAAKSGAHSTIS